MVVVIDTNVPVVSNGNSSQASPTCVTACIEQLRRLSEDVDQLVIDDRWLIIKEYRNNLHEEGQPGPGDAFLKWILTNLANPHRCEQVKITPIGTSQVDFAEFPGDPELKEFDPSDRKFIAVALAHLQRPPILQAVDSKWWDLRALLAKHVQVNFLCQDDIEQLSSSGN